MDNIIVIGCYGGEWDDSWESPVRYALSVEEAHEWIDKQVIIDEEQRQIDLKIAQYFDVWNDTQPDIEYVSGEDEKYHKLWNEREALWQTEFEQYCLANNIDSSQYDECTNKGDSYPEESWYKISEPIKHISNS